jgi:hypothetical protein
MRIQKLPVLNEVSRGKQNIVPGSEYGTQNDHVIRSYLSALTCFSY